MNRFGTGLLFGTIAGMITAATVFAQFVAPPANITQTPEAMSNAERRLELERCDALPLGAARDLCMNDLHVNRGAVAAAHVPAASRMGDGRTGAPGIGTGESSVMQDMSAHADSVGASGQGARSAP